MKAEKQLIIDALLERINGSPFVLVADYGGMTVPQFEELRNRLRACGAEFHVEKNTFIKRAAQAAELPEDLAGRAGRPSGEGSAPGAAPGRAADSRSSTGHGAQRVHHLPGPGAPGQGRQGRVETKKEDKFFERSRSIPERDRSREQRTNQIHRT